MWICFSLLTVLIVRVVIMYKLFPAYIRVDVYKHFFSNRVVEPWNSLPAEPHNFSTLSAFETFLKSVDLSTFVQQ